MDEAQDATSPELTLVADQTDEATGPNGATATFAATATDLVDGTDPVVFTENGNIVHSGDTFGLGVNTITASATDVAGNTATESFTINVVGMPLAAPTLSVSNNPNATRGQQVSLSTLVTISDPDTVGYQNLELWDDNGTVTGGQFVVNGTPQTGGQEIDVAPANVASTVFDVGTLGGTDQLWARLLENDGTLTAWQQFSVTAPALTAPAPTLTVSNDPTASPGQTVALSSLVTIADPDTVGYQNLELWDDNGTVTGGEFVVNGTPQTGGQQN